jgi:hypothetical protein
MPELLERISFSQRGEEDCTLETLSLIYDDIDRSGRDSKWAVILLRELDNYRLFG